MYLWNVKTGERVNTLIRKTDQDRTEEGSSDSSAQVALYCRLLRWALDGNELISVWNDGQVLIWEARSGKVKQTHDLEIKGSRFHAAVSSNGQWLAVGREDSSVVLRNMATGELRAITKLQDHPVSELNVAWSPDRTLLACSTSGYGAAIWLVNSQSGQVLQSINTEGIFLRSGPVWLSDSKTFVAGDGKGRISVWRRGVSRPLAIMGGRARFHPWVRWSHDGLKPVAWGGPPLGLKALASGKIDQASRGTLFAVAIDPQTDRDAGSIRLYRLKDPAHKERSSPLQRYRETGVAWERSELVAPKGRVSFIAISHDGKRLASSGAHGIHLWDLAGGEPERIPLAHESGGCRVAWSPDDGLIAGLDEKDDHLRVWDAKAKKLTHEISIAIDLPPVPENPMTSRSRGLLLSGIPGLAIRPLGVPEFSPDFAPDLPSSALAFSPDGKKLAVAKGGFVTIWEVSSGERLDIFQYAARQLCWLPDGETLAVHNGEGLVRFLNPGKAPFVVERSFPEGVLGQDGTVYAWTEPGGVVRLVDSRTGDPLETIVYLSDETWLIVTPDGHYLGSPGVEKEIVCVAQTDDGQETLTPAEFTKKYGWKNDPERVKALVGEAALPAEREP